MVLRRCGRGRQHSLAVDCTMGRAAFEVLSTISGTLYIIMFPYQKHILRIPGTTWEPVFILISLYNYTCTCTCVIIYTPKVARGNLGSLCPGGFVIGLWIVQAGSGGVMAGAL